MRTLRHDGVLEIYRSDLQVGKAGPNPEGGFLVDMIRVQGKVRDASDDMLSVVPGSGLCFTVPCPPKQNTWNAQSGVSHTGWPSNKSDQNCLKPWTSSTRRWFEHQEMPAASALKGAAKAAGLSSMKGLPHWHWH